MKIPFPPAAFWLTFLVGSLILVALPSSLSAEPAEPTPSGKTASKRPPPKPSRVRPIVLPSGSYSPDDGVGLGAFVGLRQAFPKASSDEATDEEYKLLLGERPWVWDLSLIGLIFLNPQPNGYWLSGLAYYQPRADARTEWEWNLGIYGWPWDWWFGSGGGQLRDTRRDEEDDPVSVYWHRFDHQMFRSSVRVRRRVAGPLRISLGGIFRWDVVEVLPDTLLEAQQDDLVGIDGGPMGTVEAALIVDTRDNPDDPTDGIHVSAVGEAVFTDLGPSGRFSLDLRGFVSPPNPVVVVAGEAILQVHAGPVPFYELGSIGGPEIRPRTLTGIGGLRGLDRGRVRGPLSVLFHGELRFMPPGFRIGKLGLRLEPTLFVDGTRADHFDRLGQGPPLYGSVGGGVRIILDEQVLVRLDFGASPDEVLTDQGQEVEWKVGGYAAVRHTF